MRTQVYLLGILLLPACRLLATATPPPPLSTFPSSNRIKISEALGRVGPAFSHTAECPATATVRILFHGPCADLKEGEAWAEIDPDKLALETARLENARAALEVKKQSPEPEFKKIEAERRCNEVRATLETLARQDSKLIERMNLGAEATRDYERQQRQAIEALTRELELLKRKVESTAPERDTELQTAELAYRSQEQELRRLIAQTRLTMPCAGRVTLLLPDVSKQDHRVIAGTPIAKLEDVSRYRVAIPANAAADWKLARPESLCLHLRQGGSGGMEIHWSRSGSLKINGREEGVHLFDFAEADAETARNLAGSQVQFEVVQKLPRAARLVPKLHLAQHHPELFEQGADWPEVVRALWPKAAVMAIGTREIAVDETGQSATRPTAGAGGDKTEGGSPRGAFFLSVPTGTAPRSAP